MSDRYDFERRMEILSEEEGYEYEEDDSIEFDYDFDDEDDLC